jgi:hypothetical protein
MPPKFGGSSSGTYAFKRYSAVIQAGQLAVFAFSKRITGYNEIGHGHSFLPYSDSTFMIMAISQNISSHKLFVDDKPPHDYSSHNP